MSLREKLKHTFDSIFKDKSKKKEVIDYIRNGNKSSKKNTIFSKIDNHKLVINGLNKYIKDNPRLVPIDIVKEVKEISNKKNYTNIVDKIKKNSNEKENISDQKVLLDICDSIYRKSYGTKYLKKVIGKSDNYVDCLYISKENEVFHRIIVGKKSEFTNKKFSILNCQNIESNLKKKLYKIMKSKSNIYRLKKVLEGKTKEKYKYERENSEKKESSYRYIVYSNTVNSSSVANQLTSLHLAPAIFNKLGYKIKYTTNQKIFGALGAGAFNAAYEEINDDKKIKRVIKICISSYDVVIKERKGNKQGCKAFESIKNLSANGKNIRDLFYKNEDLVLSKNKEFGSVLDLFGENNLQDDEKNLWYCISTSEFRSDGDAGRFNSWNVGLLRNNESEKLIELQAFTKGILNGLVKMHESGIIHLDVKPENTLKKLSGNKSAPYYKYSLTDFGTAINIKKRVNESDKILTWDILLDGIRGTGTPMYTRSWGDVKRLKELNYVNPELVYKIDSFTVATSMCAFYKFYLTGKSDKTGDEKEGGYKWSWQFSEQHEKGSESALVTWLPAGSDAQDLAKKLMELDMEKRWSCKQALQHPFITKTLKSRIINKTSIKIGNHKKK